jgi:hypothetical protein
MIECDSLISYTLSIPAGSEKQAVRKLKRILLGMTLFIHASQANSDGTWKGELVSTNKRLTPKKFIFSLKYSGVI